MNGSDAYYEEILYPLQNGVLKTLKDCGAPFYLTGGTALHRHFYSYRYSDDLDMFVNQDEGFVGYVDVAIEALINQTGFKLDPDAFIRNETYARVLVRDAEAILKLDFVNDSAPRFGRFASSDLFPRIDSVRNILSNKATALYRLESKDIADVWAICTHHAFEWSHVMTEANRKEIGIDAATLGDLIQSFPRHLFDTVRWRERPDPNSFYRDLSIIASDLISVAANSLVRV